MKRSFIQAYLEEISNSNNSFADACSSSVPSAPHSPSSSSNHMPASDTSQHGDETSEEHEHHPEELPYEAPSAKRQRIDFSSVAVTETIQKPRGMAASAASNFNIEAPADHGAGSTLYNVESTSSSTTRMSSVTRSTTSTYHQLQPVGLYIPKQTLSPAYQLPVDDNTSAPQAQQQYHQSHVRHNGITASQQQVRQGATTPSTPRRSSLQHAADNSNKLPLTSAPSSSNSYAVSDYTPAITIGDNKVIFGKMIATGNYGVVYKARYGIYKVAVKMMKLISEESFLRECECLVRIADCDYTLNILGFGELSNPNYISGQLKEFYIVSEYCGNRTLRSLLLPATYQEIQWQEKQRIMLEMLEAISQVHKHEICHHDIKPENIIISSEGSHVKLADFGFSSFEPSDYRKSGKGTPAYAAPEAFNNEMDFESDIWSLGICFFELLTGRIPPPDFWKLTDGDMTALRQELEQYQVPTIWQQVILDDMLNVDPKKRLECSKIIHKLVSAGITVFEESKSRINFLTRMKQEVVSSWTKKKANTSCPRLQPSPSSFSDQSVNNIIPASHDMLKEEELVQPHQQPTPSVLFPPLPLSSVSTSQQMEPQQAKQEVLSNRDAVDVSLSHSIVAQIASNSPIGEALLQDILCNPSSQKMRPVLCTKRTSFSK